MLRVAAATAALVICQTTAAGCEPQTTSPKPIDQPTNTVAWPENNHVVIDNETGEVLVNPSSVGEHGHTHPLGGH